MAEQLALVRLDDLPERPEVVEWIERQPRTASPKRWRHTGRRFLARMESDGELAQAVCEGLATGLSVRLLAWRLGVSPNTIAAARRAMTEREELEPVRKRVDALLDEVVEEGLEYWLEGMRLGVIHPGQVPIPVLAAADKKAQRDAGLIQGTERTVEGVTEERARSYLELVKLRAAEGALGGRTPKGPIIEAETVRDTGMRPAAGQPGGPAAAPTSPAGGEGAEGGGGGSAAAAATETRWERP
jgi:hypothetical protein